MWVYTIKLLLIEISIHTGNIGSDVQSAWTLWRSVHTPWTSERIIPRIGLALGQKGHNIYLSLKGAMSRAKVYCSNKLFALVY